MNEFKSLGIMWMMKTEDFLPAAGATSEESETKTADNTNFIRKKKA
jgi:hypothetical protein